VGLLGLGVEEAVGAALADGGELGERARGVVQPERQRFPVEVPAGDDGGAVGAAGPRVDAVAVEHEGVVGRAVELGLDGVPEVAEGVPDGAVDLRQAANRVGVLDAVAVPVALHDLAVGGEPFDVPRARRLAVVGPDLVDGGVAVRGRGHRHLGRQRAGGVGGPQHALGVHEHERRQPRRQLGAVDERQPLLRAERDGLQSGRRKRLVAGQAVALHPRFSFADEHEAEVREWREVAARAETPPRGDDRVDGLVEHPREQVEDSLANPRVPLRERVQPGQQERSDGRLVELVAGAGGVAPEEVRLEGFEVVGVDSGVDQRPEARVHAVHRLLAVEDVLDALPGGPDCLAGVVGDGNGSAVARDRFDVRGRQVLAVDENGVRRVSHARSPPDATTAPSFSTVSALFTPKL